MSEKRVPTEKLESLRQTLHEATQVVLNREVLGDRVESSVSVGPDGARITVTALVPKEVWDAGS